MSDLRLHHEKGVNPKLTFCPRCGGDANELVLIGVHESVGKCRTCGLTVFGAGKCPKCGTMTDVVRKIGEHEKLPASQPCDACKKELAAWALEVEEGGVYWKCPAGHSGVIKASPYATMVREAIKVAAPEPCGVAFTEKECPACNPKEVAS